MKKRKRNIARPDSMGRVNQKVVLEEIRLNGLISRAKIAQETGLSKPSVSRAVEVLRWENLIFEEDPPLNYADIGRKPTLLGFNTKVAYFESIDIGGTKLTFGLSDSSGESLQIYSFKNPGSWEKIVKLISSKVRETLKKTGISFEKLKGIAIAAQGVVDLRRGTVSSAPNVSGMDEYPLRNELESSLSVPVWVENDVNLAAIGEYWKEKQNCKNMVYISLGTVIGGAIILNGQLFHGTNYYAGEVGWLITDKSLLFKDIGKYGYLEILATGPALTKKAKKMIAEGLYKDDPFVPSVSMSSKTIFKAYKEGSNLAKQIVKQWIEDLGIAVSNISSLLNPELVILSGGLTRSGGFFLDELRKVVSWGTQKPPKIKISDLQNKASLYGGLKLCRDNYMDSLFLEEQEEKNKFRQR